MAFSLFKKNVEPLTVLELLDEAALHADKAALKEISNEIEQLQATERQYETELAKLEKQLAYDPLAETVEIKGTTLENILLAVEKFNPETTVNKAAVQKQLDTLKKWHKVNMMDELKPVCSKLTAVSKAQEAKLRQVEEELETPTNTEEVDKVFEVINAELASVVSEYNRLVAELIRQDVATFQRERLDHLQRKTIEGRQAEALRRQKLDAEYAYRFSHPNQL